MIISNRDAGGIQFPEIDQFSFRNDDFLLMHILQAEYVITYHNELINYGVRVILFAQIISNLQRNLVFQVQCWMQLL